jgi:hypothetical protein
LFKQSPETISVSNFYQLLNSLIINILAKKLIYTFSIITVFLLLLKKVEKKQERAPENSHWTTENKFLPAKKCSGSSFKFAISCINGQKDQNHALS